MNAELPVFSKNSVVSEILIYERKLAKISFLCEVFSNSSIDSFLLLKKYTGLDIEKLPEECFVLSSKVKISNPEEKLNIYRKRYEIIEDHLREAYRILKNGNTSLFSVYMKKIVDISMGKYDKNLINLSGKTEKME